MAKKILVVDDEPEIVDFIRVILEDAQYEVISASNGQEAIAMIEDEKPNLILSDVMMPRLDGYQLARIVKYNEDFNDIPVILVTARDQERDKEIGHEVGADDYLVKPIDDELLLKLVKKHLGD